MATLLLSAAGAAIGGSFGGSIAGLTSGVLGKALGGTLGAVLDQRLTGLGSEPVETGRVERFKVMGASEGAALPRVFGRMRVAGQVIWSSRFLESVNTSSVGGKGGGGGSQEVREFSYSISLAIAVCEGEVARVGRIWADGQALDLFGVTWRLHSGSEDQIPDPVIAAVEGAENSPAYRGTAYVVFENLDLTPFGNRIPQFNFEVFRRPSVALPGLPRPPALDVRGVALVPGTGEYSLATEPVYFDHGKGRSVVANVNNDRGRPDLVVSLEQLRSELPEAKAVSLVVSWFGNDLRCDRCSLRPAVEQTEQDGQQLAWRASGVGRFDAQQVSRVDGRPLFGGTPSDASVIQAIQHMTATGQAVMFYPFILMDILEGNDLEDPWSGASGQPAVPWRGRITLSVAPGRAGSHDKTAAAAAEVSAFFGTAQSSDFSLLDGEIVYSGPAEWSYRRFILHYAHLCAAAGGVDSFCIGSELRSLTQIRDGAASYPAVRALCELAADVRGILGSAVKIGYAADWSEYFGHHPNDGSGDVLFHLDPLWANAAIDFVGIDNYMPLSDWRDGSGHADAAAGSIYNLDYLQANVQGGEGFDWYYADADGRRLQDRLPISDGAYGEDWVFRFKDIASWWSQPHVDRLGGVKAATPTDWRPCSKPIWFTELGCPAVDKGTNQPNVFHDPKSSESFFPHSSNGNQDDFIQYRYLQAMYASWSDPKRNPRSEIYEGSMVNMDRAFVWAWDARPWPDFPDRLDVWVDGLNYDRGHWINTRLSLAALENVVAEICVRSGLPSIDVAALNGAVTGFLIGAVESARQSLQPLMLTYGFDSFGIEDKLAFVSRSGRVSTELSTELFAVSKRDARIALTRGSNAESPGRVAIGFVRSDKDYQPGAAEVMAPEAVEPDTAQSSVPIVLSDAEASAVAERWLSEGRVARDSVKFDLPLSMLSMTAGDVVSIDANGHVDLFRVDRIEDMGSRSVGAVRIEPTLYDAPVYSFPSEQPRRLVRAGPVYAEFLDLPLLTGEEKPHAPHVAVAKSPWAGPVAIFSATADFGYAFNREIRRPAIVGETLGPLVTGTSGCWMRAGLRVRVAGGALQTVSESEVLNGANAAAVRYGGSGDWEVLQFISAVLVAPGEYFLGGLLRGQAGTDGVVPPVWPAGSDFVLLDRGVVQVDLPQSARGLERHFRIGPSNRPYNDSSYLHHVQAFAGVGLRPYRPAHLAARRLPDGDLRFSWTRRTRLDGDSWEGAEVPLGEDSEQYRVIIRNGDAILREWILSSCEQIYQSNQQDQDGNIAEFLVEVVQLSDRFGAGPAAILAVAT